MGARSSGTVATCVAIGSRAVLIEGAPGCGKSTLALMLIDRGARLIGDDSVLLEAKGQHLFARPHPNTHGLIEVRNLGLVRMPVCESAAVSLVLRLDDAAPRYIECAQTVMIEGISLPMLRLRPDSPALAIKAELALDRFGLEEK